MSPTKITRIVRNKENSASAVTSVSWPWAIGLCLLTMALLLCLGSYSPEDPSFSSFSSTWRAPQNVLGYVGSWAADIFFQVFGYGAWLLPVLLFVALLRWSFVAAARKEKILGARWYLALSFLVLAVGLFIDLIGLKSESESFPAQGLVGIVLASISKPMLGVVGSYLLVFGLVWAFCFAWWIELPEIIWTLGKNLLGTVWRSLSSRALEIIRSKSEDSTEIKIPEKPDLGAVKIEQVPESVEVLSEPLIRDAAVEGFEAKKEKIQRLAPRPVGPIHWSLPPISLLEAAKRKVKGPTKEQLLETARKIGFALKSFEIEGEVVEITPGPIITMYEFLPAPGVRVQKIIASATDLAMALGAPAVRIVAPIPGKSVAGVEVPNNDKEDIILRDVFENTLDRSKNMRLPLVLGKDAEGKPVCEDLSRMPHLLIGGATSMGKSVLVNSILTGLLCRFSPAELRLVIVDPKLVEFKAFEDIPHLLLPIVNDPSDASQALKWAVSETKRRYLVMQKYSAKNLESYNQKISQGEAIDGEMPEKFPYIVIIVDELAELMLTAKKDVEQSIVRLTQLARAAGLHLIMSTQRPSADVVTGLIKSNCPSRAALRVASSSDSRIILDCTGAEQLLGRGDMFFTSTGPMGLKRVQSAFVSDPEIEKVCEFWRSQGEPEYKDEILAPEEDTADHAIDGETDSLYEEVLGFAKEKGKISTSLIQRRFQVGYSRAARIMEQLEERGIVGEQQAAGKPRDVVI